MPFTSTAGGASSNSYTSVASADTYLLTESIGHADWEDEADADKEAALMTATREMERMSWKGTCSTTTQALEWPRTGVYDRKGNEYSTSTVPTAIQQACAELAFAILQSAAIDDGEDLSAFKSIAIGDEKFELRDGHTDTLPKVFTNLVRDFILTTQARILRG
jgi:hypothetical protein